MDGDRHAQVHHSPKRLAVGVDAGVGRNLVQRRLVQHLGRAQGMIHDNLRLNLVHIEVPYWDPFLALECYPSI